MDATPTEESRWSGSSLQAGRQPAAGQAPAYLMRGTVDDKACRAGGACLYTQGCQAGQGSHPPRPAHLPLPACLPVCLRKLLACLPACLPRPGSALFMSLTIDLSGRGGGNTLAQQRHANWDPWMTSSLVYTCLCWAPRALAALAREEGVSVT